jgi:hypothetical protein
MALTLWILSLVVAALAVADQARRSPSEWTAADRERGYWMTWTVLAGLVYLGLVAAIVYAIGVVPRFGHVSASDDGFRRTVPPPQPAAPAVRQHVPPQRLWSGTVAPAQTSAQEPLPETPPRRKLIIEIDDV